MTSHQTLIAQGAEAIITLVTQSPRSKNFVIKNRIKKSYRIPEIDKKIRERRTRAEEKLLFKTSQIINCPKPFFKNSIKESTKLKIPFVQGKKLSDNLDKFPLAKQKSILRQIGKDIAKLHKENIIHGDLTTSNMIYTLNHPKTPRSKKNSSLITSSAKRLDKVSREAINPRAKGECIYIIDFGLGYFNGKYEDKAVDIHLLKQALEAKHFKNWKILFAEFEKGYKSINKFHAEKVFNQLKKVEKRGRYKS